MNQVISFHLHGTSGNEAYMLPTFWVDADYEKVGVRILAETAPVRDAKINIYDDGASIFSNRTNRSWNLTTGVEITPSTDTEAVLPANQNTEEIADDFNNNIIEKGSRLTCKLVDSGGGKDFTVQLELRQTSEDEEQED